MVMRYELAVCGKRLKVGFYTFQVVSIACVVVPLVTLYTLGRYLWTHRSPAMGGHTHVGTVNGTW